jgi:hypothetical protein
VYSQYCEQHQFEAELLPKAVKMAWPMKIDFEVLHKQILGLKKEMKTGMKEPKKSEFFQKAERAYQRKQSQSHIHSWDHFSEQGAG